MMNENQKLSNNAKRRERKLNMDRRMLTLINVIKQAKRRKGID